MAEINDLNVTDASNTGRFPEGQNPSTVNDGMRALEGIIARAAKDTFDGVLVTGGTSTAFTATPNRSLSTSYYDGLQFSVEFNATCGANPTLNVGGKGAKYLAWADGTSLTTSDILSGTHSIVKYDVTNERWLVMTSPPKSYQPLDADLTAIAALTRTRGDLIRGGASAWERVALGASGKVLKSDGADAVWGDGGKLLQRVTATLAIYTTTTTIIPYDDTIPQNTEGVELLTASITPTSASSTIRVTYHTPVAGASSNAHVIAALFKDSGADALQATDNTLGTAGVTAGDLSLVYEEAAGSTSARTYKIRVGSNSGATVYLNGADASRRFGGVSATYLIIEEIAA